MSKKQEFDTAAAHKYFSTHCFNKAWDLIGKETRTEEEDEEMIRLTLASTWHWSQRDDCTEKNLSIGLWQAARIFAILNQVENARRYGQLCLQASQGIDPFYLGYAYEALARAESVAGNKERKEYYLEEASRVAGTVPDADNREYLLKDLESIR